MEDLKDSPQVTKPKEMNGGDKVSECHQKGLERYLNLTEWSECHQKGLEWYLKLIEWKELKNI